jgi:hypothetical protein
MILSATELKLRKANEAQFVVVETVGLLCRMRFRQEKRTRSEPGFSLVISSAMSRWREIVSTSLLITSALLAAAAIVAQVDLGSKPDPTGLSYFVLMPAIGLIALGIGGACGLSAFLLSRKVLKYSMGIFFLSGLPLVLWPLVIYYNVNRMAEEQRERQRGEEKLNIVRDMVKGTDNVSVFQASTNAVWPPVQMNLTNGIRK